MFPSMSSCHPDFLCVYFTGQARTLCLLRPVFGDIDPLLSAVLYLLEITIPDTVRYCDCGTTAHLPLSTKCRCPAFRTRSHAV